MNSVKEFFILFKKHGGILDAFVSLISIFLIISPFYDAFIGQGPSITGFMWLAVGFAILTAQFRRFKGKSGQPVPQNVSAFGAPQKRNFWAWYPSILILLNLPVIVYVFSHGSEAGLMAIPFFFLALLMFFVLPGAIWVLMQPTKAVKKTVGIYASILLIPPLLLQFYILVIIPFIPVTQY